MTDALVHRATSSLPGGAAAAWITGAPMQAARTVIGTSGTVATAADMTHTIEPSGIFGDKSLVPASYITMLRVHGQPEGRHRVRRGGRPGQVPRHALWSLRVVDAAQRILAARVVSYAAGSDWMTARARSCRNSHEATFIRFDKAGR